MRAGWESCFIHEKIEDWNYLGRCFVLRVSYGTRTRTQVFFPRALLPTHNVMLWTNGKLTVKDDYNAILHFYEIL